MSSFIFPGDYKVKVNNYSSPRPLYFTGDGVSVAEDAPNNRFTVTITGSINSASNVGDGEGDVFKQLNDDDLEFKTIKAGNGIDITNNTDDVTIDVDESELTLDDIGGTLGVTKGGTGKTSITQHALLKGGATNTIDEIAASTDGKVLTMVSGTPAWEDAPGASGGEANTADNVGLGEGNVFRDKSGVTIHLKTLKEGAGINITDNTDDVTLAVDDSIIASTDNTLTLTNKTILDSGSGNQIGVHVPYVYTIYQDASNYFLRNNWTGEITSYSNTDIIPVIDDAVSGIVSVGSNNDSVYGGTIFIDKGSYTALTQLSITAAITTRHGIKLLGEGEGTHINFDPDSGSPLTNGILIDIEAYGIEHIHFTCNEYVTNIIHVIGNYATTTRRSDYGKIMFNMFEGAVGKYTNVAPTSGQTAILIDGSAVGVFWTKIWGNDFGAFETNIKLDGAYTTSASCIGNTSINSEKHIVVSNGSGQHTIEHEWIQGDTAVGLSGIEISGTGERISINSITTELHKTGASCQAILLDTGVDNCNIGNAVTNVYNGTDDFVAIRDNSGTFTNNYDERIVANGQHYLTFEDNIVKTNASVFHNFFSGQARFYDASFDHYWKIGNTAELTGDRLVSFPSMTEDGDFVVTNAPQTITEKFIDPTDNQIPYTEGYAFSIYVDGSVCQLRNNGDGTVTSYATLGPAVDAVLANTNNPTVKIHSGVYNLASDFTGWQAVSNMVFDCLGSVYINVPTTYAGSVWKFEQDNAGVANCKFIGGQYDEQGTVEGTATNDWTVFNFAPLDSGGTGAGAVYENDFMFIKAWRCKKMFNFATTDKSWINNNNFMNIFVTVPEYFATFSHSGTFTAQQSGSNYNSFLNCSIQSSAGNAATPYRYPQTQGGIVDINGFGNQFMECNMWDQYLNGSAISCSISANAYATIIEGGIMTVQNYTNSGTKTWAHDYWGGLQTGQQVYVNGDRIVVTGKPSPDTWQAALLVDRLPDTGFEILSQHSMSGGVDYLTVENGTNASGSFSPIIRASVTSDNSPSTLEALYIGGLIRSNTASLDTGSVPIVKVSSRLSHSPFYVVNRPIFGVNNYDTDEYLFYPTYADFKGNGIKNASISRTDNTLPYVSPYAFSIYRETDTGDVKLVNNATGAVTSYTSLGPAVDAVLANTSDPTCEVHDGFYDLDVGFSGWDVIKLTNIHINENAYINVPEGYSGSVWNLSPTDTTVNHVTIDGGRYDEQGSSPTYLWDCIRMEPISTNPPTTIGAVYHCHFKNMLIWRCNRPIYLHTTDKSWANQNLFQNIYSEGCQILGAEFEHTGTWTSGESGTHGNYFEQVSGQSTTLDVVNLWPTSLYGFKNVQGDFNCFVDCTPWDLYLNGGSAHGMTIGTNGVGTIVMGGIADAHNFVDDGTNTSVNGWNGIYHNNLATFGKDTTFNETVYSIKAAESSTAEQLFNMTVDDATGDVLTIENAYTVDGLFTPMIRGTVLASGHSAGTNALYLQGIINPTNDTTNTEPAIVLGAKNSGNTAFVNRPMVGIYNLFTPVYNFYPTYADFTGKQLLNAAIPDSQYGAYLYHIYIDSSDSKYKAYNTATGVVTDSGSTTDCLALFNTVIAAASTAKKPIFVDKGKYLFSAAPTIAGKWISIEGVSTGHSGGGQGDYTTDTVLKKAYTDNTNPFIDWDGSSTWTQQKWHDIYIEGKDSNDDGTGTFDDGGIGFQIKSTSTAISEIYDCFRNVTISHFSTGLKLMKCWQLHFHELSLYNCGSKGIHLTGDGVDADSRCFNITFFGGEVRFAPTNVHIEFGNQTSFIGSMLEGDDSSPYTLVNSIKMDADATNSRFIDCSFENNVDGITLISDAGTGNTIEHGRFGGLLWTAQTIYNAVSGCSKANFNFNVVEPYVDDAVATILLSSGCKDMNIIGNHGTEVATNTSLVVTDSSGNSTTNLILGNTSGADTIDNVIGPATNFLSTPTIENNTVGLYGAALLSLYRDDTTNFLDWGIKFEGKSDTGVRKDWGRFFASTDSNANGAEETWFGAEYMVGGVFALRGMFYNNSVYFGPNAVRTGISSENSTAPHLFTLPDSSGEITVNDATQTISNKTLETTTMSDAANIVLNTTTGTKIGTGTTQKLGFFNATPIVQPAANADTSGATLGQLETEVNELKATLRSLGLIAT